MNFELTDEQNVLIKKLIEWYRSGNIQYYAYSGPPGTGKTTIIKTLIDRLGLSKDEVAGCAFTGMAALRMTISGIPACTIHSLIYYPVWEEVIRDGKIVLKKNGDPQKVMTFYLKSKLDKDYKLIVVDEYSMVTDQMCEDLLSFGIPIIFVGDEDQLPPVFGSNSMIKPNFFLTKIMRQAEGNPIVYLSQCILHDKDIPIGEYGNSRIIENIPLENNLIADYDMIICGKNELREKLNRTIHEEIFKRSDNMPYIGDKIVCKQNNRDRYIPWDEINSNIYLTNGLIGYIVNDKNISPNGKYKKIDFRPEFMDTIMEDVPLDLNYFTADLGTRKNYGLSKYNKFELGYVITVHGSQGSQYERLLFFDQPFWDRQTTKKLRYTAITRAINSITIVIKTPERFNNDLWIGEIY